MTKEMVVTHKDKSCKWCEEKLIVEDSLHNSVCMDCYRKLAIAGISDEEIFKPKIIVLPHPA